MPPPGHQLAHPGNVRDCGYRIDTIGVHYSRKGLIVVHRAKHAIVLRNPGETDWVELGRQGYHATEYMCVELGTWIVLKTVEPGRKWRRSVQELIELADKHPKGTAMAKTKRKPKDTGTDFKTTITALGVIPKLTVSVTKTRDGKSDYVQIMSADMLTINVVLVADTIEIEDRR